MLTGIGAVERVWRSDDAVVVELAAAMKPAEAKQFIRDQLRWLARIAEECDRPHTVVTHRAIKPRKVPASMASSPLEEFSSIAPLIHVLSPMPASVELMRALTTIAENPGQQWFLHRVSPDFNRMTQIAISEAARSLIVGATIEQALGRSRSDYMRPSELSRMQQEFRQRLSLGGSAIEYRFDLFSPATKANWREVEYDYLLIGQLPGGDLLQLGQCRNVREIAAPVSR
jgi:hypothetical protein